MAKQITSELEGKWYKIPDYKIMLVRDSNITADKKRISCSTDVANLFQSYLEGLDREHFCIAMLDRKNNILGINTVSIGTVSASIVHPREVFKPAIIIGASGIILCHNHPSGITNPSNEDIEITNKLKEAGKILGIEIIDHIIIGDDYFSFMGNGLI